MEPLVSVNLATYNRAHLLDRCIPSIVNQKYENMEIIIVDDCSTDNTRQVIEDWIAKDSRIKYLRHEKNLHLAEARNTAIQHSGGKYIAFMDDDDEWIDCEKIRKQVEIFESYSHNNLGFVCTGVRLYENGTDYVDKIIDKPDNLKARILERNGIMYTPTVMAKSQTLWEVGGADPKLKRGVDGEIYRTAIVEYLYDVYFMKECTTAIYEYGDDRITPQNTCKSSYRALKANLVLINRHKIAFILHPISFIKRFKGVLVSFFKACLWRFLYSEKAKQ